MCQGNSFSHITKSNEPYLFQMLNASWGKKKVNYFESLTIPTKLFSSSKPKCPLTLTHLTKLSSHCAVRGLRQERSIFLVSTLH